VAVDEGRGDDAGEVVSHPLRRSTAWPEAPRRASGTTSAVVLLLSTREIPRQTPASEHDRARAGHGRCRTNPTLRMWITVESAASTLAAASADCPLLTARVARIWQPHQLLLASRRDLADCGQVSPAGERS
jgi:hypothetical protein